MAVSPLGISPRGWTIALDDAGLVTDCCGLDYVLDPLSEREMCPAFPSQRGEALRCGVRDERNAALMQNSEPQSPRRPQVNFFFLIIYNFPLTSSLLYYYC